MKPSVLKAKLIAGIILASLLSACTSIPDVQPFANSTANLATALNKGFAQTENQLLALKAEYDALKDPKKKQAVQTRLDELRKRLKPTKEAINALVAYTDSLAALAQAGKTGKEAAQKLTNSFEGLFNAVGQLLPLPGLPAGVKTAFDLITTANGAIANMRARHALKEAAEDAAPAVQVIAQVLAANFAELDNLSQAAGIAADDAVQQNHHAVFDYHQTLVDADERIEVIVTLINQYIGTPAEKRAQAERLRNAGNKPDAQRALDSIPSVQTGILDQIKGLDPEIGARLAGGAGAIGVLETRKAELLAQAKSNRDELTRINPEYQLAVDRSTAINTATKTGSDLFAKGQEAIKAWAKAHEDLKLALEKKQGLTFRELESIVKEIVEIFDKGGNK